MDLSLVFKSGDVVLIGVFCPDVVDERGNMERHRDPLHQIPQSEKRQCSGKRVDAECVYAG